MLSGKAQDYDHGIAYASLRDLLASVPADDFDDASRVIFGDLLHALDAAVLGQRAGPDRRRRPAARLPARDQVLQQPVPAPADHHRPR